MIWARYYLYKLALIPLGKDRDDRWHGLSVLFRTEWSEAVANDRSRALPHCCTQGGCWMHTQSGRCTCRCVWCRVARLLKAGQE